MGRHPRQWRAYSRHRHRLVGTFFPAGNTRDRRGPLRWLSFRELRPQPKKTSPSGMSAARRCHGPGATTSRARPAQHRQPVATRSHGVRRHLHPMPFARACRSPPSTATTTTGRSDIDGRSAAATTSGSWTATRWGDDVPCTSGTGRRTRTGCRVTTSSQSLMYARGVTCASCHDLARHAQQCRPGQVRASRLPDVPRTGVTERTAHRDDRTAHPSPAGIGRQRLRQLSHAENCRHAGRRQGQEPHVQVHRAGDGRTAEDAGPVHDVSHGQDNRLGRGDPEIVAGVFAVACRAVVRRFYFCSRSRLPATAATQPQEAAGARTVATAYGRGDSRRRTTR